MNRRATFAISLTSVLIFLISAVGAVVFAIKNGAMGRADISLLVATGMFVVVGALILSRRPENSMGWIFCAIGVLWALGSVAVEYSVFATSPEHSEQLPGAWVAAWFGEWNWIPFWILALAVTPSLFPTGKPLSFRWKRFLMVTVVAAAAMTVLIALDPVLDIEGTKRTLANPIGIQGATWLDPDHQESLSSVLLFPVMFGSAAAAGVSTVLRFRRSRGMERLQLKWFASAVVLLVVGWFVLGFTPATGGIAVGYGLVLSLVPIAAGVAILRYRLYNIDVLINRTLVYGLLTAALLASYLLIVVALSRVLDPVTRDSDMAVAASTLAVAALFRPLRRQFQGFIDRRFYRAKYDASRAVASLASRLRDETNVESVRGDVLGLVGTTLQPAHASLWLRGGTRP